MDGFRRMLAKMHDVWDEMHIDPQEFIDGGDRSSPSLASHRRLAYG
jgi:hypothetical protein